jgi:hypothetical protein
VFDVNHLFLLLLRFFICLHDDLLFAIPLDVDIVLLFLKHEIFNDADPAEYVAVCA